MVITLAWPQMKVCDLRLDHNKHTGKHRLLETVASDTPGNVDSRARGSPV